MSNRFKLFFGLTLVFFASACESGSDESPSTSLVGTWTAVSLDADVQSTSSFNGTNVTTSSIATGSNFNYDLTFTETAFTTSGSYTVSSTVSINGGASQTFSSDFSNVSGSGTYTSTEDEIMLNGTFLSLELNGLPAQTSGQVQTASYEINGSGELVISQEESMTVTQSGVTTSLTAMVTSRWTRK